LKLRGRAWRIRSLPLKKEGTCSRGKKKVQKRNKKRKGGEEKRREAIRVPHDLYDG
jgi:hypothetical protein